MVVIKGFEMPESCLKCNFLIKDFEYPTCKIHKTLGGNYNTTWEHLGERAGWCPLEEVKEQTMKDVVYGFANLTDGEQRDVFKGIASIAQRNPLIS